MNSIQTMNSALAIQVLPKTSGGRAEAHALVDKAIDAIERSGLPYTVCPFETVVEGPLDQLLTLIGETHRAVLEAGAPGVSTYMKLFSSTDLASSKEKVAKYRAKGH